MDQAKKGFVPVLQGVKLSQTQCPTTAEDREKMKVIPYASAIGSIVGERSNFKKFPTHTQDHGDA